MIDKVIYWRRDVVALDDLCVSAQIAAPGEHVVVTHSGNRQRYLGEILEVRADQCKISTFNSFKKPIPEDVLWYYVE